MKKLLVLAVLFLSVSLTGCGSSPVTTTSTSGTGSTGGTSGDTFSGSLTITGTLRTSQSSSVQSLSTQADSVATGYSILATNVDTGSGIKDTTGSDGTYSLKLTKGDTYVFVIFDSSNRFAAVVTGNEVIPASSSGMVPQDIQYVVSGFSASTSTSATAAEGVDTTLYPKLGNAFWTGTKVATLADVGKLSSTMALVPVDKYAAQKGSGGGAAATGGDDGNFGKGSTAVKPSGSTGNDIDSDLDGIPDYLDPDADGNSILDIVENPLLPFQNPTTNILGANITYLLSADNYTEANTFELHMSVYPVKGKESLFSGVTIVSAPPYMEDATLNQGNYQYLDKVPTLFQTFKSSGNILYKATADPIPGIQTSSSFWVVIVRPGIENVKVGDAFTFRVAYSDGTSEDITSIVGYAFSDFPKLVSYKVGDSATVTAPTSNSSSNPIMITRGSSLTLTWSRPKDENGDDLKSDGEISIQYGQGVSSQRVTFTDTGSGSTLSKTFTVSSSQSITASFPMLLISTIGTSHAGQTIYFKYQ